MPRKKILFRATAILSCFLAAACNTSRHHSGNEPPEKVAASYRISSDVAAGKVRLQRAIEPLFDGSMPGETRALVIMHRGRLVAEAYGPGFGPNSKLLGWSMSKTVTALLVGLMVADGRLALDRPAPVPAWSSPGDPRGEITVRQLLMMTSGLAHREGLDADEDGALYDADTPRMLFTDGMADMARYAENRPLETAPGEKFEYSTPTSVILSDIMTRALTPSADPEKRRDAMLAFAQGRLFEPLNINSMTPEFDAKGTMIGGSMVHATARDWAMLGEFMRHNGAVRNAQIMPTSWLRLMKQPNGKARSFGMQLWLNRARADGSSPLFPDREAANVFASLGHLGQYMIVVPDRKLTIVRLGHTTGKENERAVTDQLANIIALF